MNQVKTQSITLRGKPAKELVCQECSGDLPLHPYYQGSGYNKWGPYCSEKCRDLGTASEDQLP